MTISPKAHDEAEAALFDELAKAEARRDSAVSQAHHRSGDHKRSVGREYRWGMSDDEAIQNMRTRVHRMGPDEVIWGNDHPVNILKAYDEATAWIDTLVTRIEGMEATYREHRWTRYFPCLSDHGHIHSSLRGCSSVYPTTPMGWTPQLSGKTVEDAVAELGPALCTICFPSAPVEWTAKTLTQVERDKGRSEREAAKRERDAAKARKTLTESQQFRGYGDEGRGEWITTVAAAKQALRQMIEFKHYSGPNNHHCWYESSVRAAESAKRVLLEREAANPGTGATQAEIDTILAKAEKRQLAYFK